MNNKIKFYIRAAMPYLGLIVILGGSSALVYLLQVKLFRDPKTTEFYLLQDLAFLPLQVLLGVLIIERILSQREKKLLLRKLNMVIGVFFTECGSELLALFASTGKPEDSQRFLVTQQWTKRDFLASSAAAASFHPQAALTASHLEAMQLLLRVNRDRILRLLENPNLLENERFTELLWAVSHLSEELEFRPALQGLPQHDLDHLRGDILRAYRVLVIEWLAYMQHLQGHYPYLFSLAVRKSPFARNQNA